MNVKVCILSDCRIVTGWPYYFTDMIGVNKIGIIAVGLIE